MNSRLLSISNLSRLLDAPERTVREGVKHCHAKHAWRGMMLNVIAVSGNGGRSGLQYRIEFDSLPPALQQKWLDIHGDIEPVATKPLSTDSTNWDWRLAIIQPALQTAPRSTERAQVIRDLAAELHRDGRGRERRFGASTLRGWLEAYEARGVNGLARKNRADKGKGRTLISRKWDETAAATGLGLDECKAIAATLRKFIRSAWAGPATFAGWYQIAQVASAKLQQLTSTAAGMPINNAACRLTRNLIERERKYRVVGLYDRDHKKWDDNSKPRIRRHIDDLMSMKLVAGDIHPQDIIYRRDDGSEATAKLSAWLDIGTGRIRLDPFFLEKGEGIRQSHVILSYIRMTQDQHWGLPGGLYLDNGGEYNWAEFADDAMRLQAVWFGQSPSLKQSQSSITRAKPYNAAAKGILEGAFNNLEKRFFSMLPGWIGGDRLRKKTANLGKSLVAWPGTKDELLTAIRNAETWYNDTPQYGRLGGRSPNEVLAKYIEDGWLRTDIAEADLLQAFCKRDSRIVRKGVVTIDGQVFYDDALACLSAGTRVQVGIPKWGALDRIAIWSLDEVFLCVAGIDQPFAHDDSAGAKEAARRQKVSRKAIAELRPDTEPLDGRAIVSAMAGRATLPPVPGRGGLVQFDPNQTIAGQAFIEEPPQRKKREDDEYEARRQKSSELLRRLTAKRSTGTDG